MTRNKPMTYLDRSLERTAMTRSVAMPSYLGTLLAGNLYHGFTVQATAVFFNCMKISSAEDLSSALNRRS